MGRDPQLSRCCRAQLCSSAELAPRGTGAACAVALAAAGSFVVLRAGQVQAGGAAAGQVQAGEGAGRCRAAAHIQAGAGCAGVGACADGLQALLAALQVLVDGVAVIPGLDGLMGRALRHTM